MEERDSDQNHARPSTQKNRREKKKLQCWYAGMMHLFLLSGGEKLRHIALAIGDLCAVLFVPMKVGK